MCLETKGAAIASATTSLGGGSGAPHRWSCQQAAKCSFSRTVVLRSLLIVSLLTAAGVCAAFSYLSLRNTEREVGIQTYESIAVSALTGARATTQRKIQGSDVMAAVLSYSVPDKASWPMIALDGYIPIASKVAALSSSTTQSLMVFVDPDDSEEWEAHTKQVYIDQGRPENAGVSDFGFGVWKTDEESSYADQRVHDVSGEVSRVVVKLQPEPFGWNAAWLLNLEMLSAVSRFAN